MDAFFDFGMRFREDLDNDHYYDVSSNIKDLFKYLGYALAGIANIDFSQPREIRFLFKEYFSGGRKS